VTQQSQPSQTQKTTKGDSPSQAFNDLLKSLKNVLAELFRVNPSLVITFIFILLICCFVLFRAINSNYLYSLFVTFLFIFLSVCLYIKEKSSLTAIFSFSLGIFTAFTVTWNGSSFSIFFISFIILVIGILFIAAIRAAADEQEKLIRAANFYMSDFETNKKDLQEVYERVKKQDGLLPVEKKSDAILFFAYLKVPKQHMVILIDALNYLYTVTKMDTELLQILLNNLYHLSDAENDLTSNIETLKLYILKRKSTPSNLVKILTDALHIAIENDIDFVTLTDTILIYLSRGYAQTSIVEQLSRKFAKKTP